MTEKNHPKREAGQKLQFIRSKFGGLRAKFADYKPMEMTMPDDLAPVYRLVDKFGNEPNIALADGTKIEFRDSELYDPRTWFEAD